MRVTPRSFLRWLPLWAVVIAVAAVATTTFIESRRTGPRFTISAKTTVLTEPLTADGFVDYAEAARRRIQEIPPEQNAARLLLKALGPKGLRDPDQWEAACEQLGLPPLPREGDYLIGVSEWCEPIAEEQGVDVYDVSSPLYDEIGLCMEVPWQADEHPDVAAWLAANESHIATLLEASRCTGFREPVHMSDWFYGSMIERMSMAAHLLTLRAMERLKKGDLESAWGDVLATFRLGRLASQGELLYFTAGGFESIATDATAAILSSPLMTPEWLDRIDRDWNGLPSWRDYSDYVDTSQRLQVLALIQETSRRPAEEFKDGWELKWTAIPSDSKLMQFYLLRVNWDDVMMDVNRRMDDLRDAVSETDLAEKSQQLEWWDKGDRRLMDDFRTWRLDIEDSIHTFVVRGATCVEGYAAETTPRNIEAQARAMTIAFAVERYRLDQGSLPGTLYELVPAYLDRVPIDPYAPKQRVQFYHTTGEGYIIHNADWRALDSEEPTPEENYFSFRVRMPVAPWLLPEEVE